MASWLRRLASVLLLGVLVFAALTLRTISEGERAMERSEVAFDAGDLREAIVHARRAATLYVPGAPHVRAAYERLGAIAVGAETIGNREVAIEAWAAIRAAALESRHVASPREADLSRANQNLARLASEHPARTEALARLSVDRAPQAPWIALLAAGFALIVAGIATFVSRGVTREGHFSPRAARWAVALSAIGVACWTIAVIRA